MNTLDAMYKRSACRAYVDKAVEKELIEKIMQTARFAPSGVNTQPWQVYVVQGQTKDAITRALIAERENNTPFSPDYAYYPETWVEPYKSRRKATGLALYSALQIGREDHEAQKQAWYNNYRFFGAPVGLLIFIDKRMNQGSWMDLGMFLQNIMLAATDLGLATCPQASIADYPQQVRNILKLDDSHLLACAISLGYADEQHPVNQYRTERMDINEFCHWYN